MLQVKHVSKTYGEGKEGVVAVADLDFEVDEGEFVCIVGPSGCGKTTLLKCLAGLLPASSGEVLLNGRPVTAPPEQMALVFQDYSRSLFPWMSVRQNVAFPLKRQRLSRRERDLRVTEAITSVGLAGSQAQYPWQLSGGMQQRVAIARAIAYRSDLLVMDEPFASVDAQSRADLEDLTLAIRKQYGVTVLLVTHDIDEAVYLADRILVLTSSPSEISEVLPVSLPRPRDQMATKELPDFAHLRAHVYRLIKGGPVSSGAAYPEPNAPIAIDA